MMTRTIFELIEDGLVGRCTLLIVKKNLRMDFLFGWENEDSPMQMHVDTVTAPTEPLYPHMDMIQCRPLLIFLNCCNNGS